MTIKINGIELIVPNEVTEFIDCYSYRRHIDCGNPLTGVSRIALPVDISGESCFFINTVEPNVNVEPHSHDDSLFKYILSGALELNGKKYQAGDWFIIPANQEYSIKTEEGYSIIVLHNRYYNPPRP